MFTFSPQNPNKMTETFFKKMCFDNLLIMHILPNNGVF